MKYFSYKNRTNMAGSWEIFAGLGEELSNTQPNQSGLFEHVEDILKASMNGSEVTSDPDFDLRSYEHRCKINDKNARRSNAKKLCYIVPQAEIGDGDSLSLTLGDVAETALASETLREKETPYDEVLNAANLLTSRQSLTKINKQYLSKGINIEMMLENARLGVPEAFQNIVKICKEDSCVRDIVATILEGCSPA